MSGQVFLMMPDGDSQLLSLVAVRVFDRSDMRRFLRDREEVIDARMGLLADREAEKKAQHDVAITAREEAEARLRQRRDEVAREREALERELGRRIADHRGSIRQNEAFIIDLTETPQPPEGIPTREEYQAFSERRERWFSMNRSEREAWREALGTQNRNLEQAIEAIEEELNAQLLRWEEELNSLRAELEARQAAEAEAEAPWREAVASREAFPTIFDFFQDLPEFTDMVRTDANGEFALNVSKGEQKAILAMVDREIQGNREKRCWLLWVDPARYDGRKLLLSNHNAITWDSRPESFSAWARSD